MVTSIKILQNTSETNPSEKIDTCPACLKNNAVAFVSTPKDLEYFVTRPQSVQIMRCNTCSCLYQTPFPQTEETNQFYADDYQNYSKSSVPFLSELMNSMNKRYAQGLINRFGKEARFLDFGCGNGDVLMQLHGLGAKNLSGYDVALRLPSEFQDHISIYDNLSTLEKSGQKFDVIRMHHVIEHLADLDDIMSLLGRLLTPTGTIIGQTPNAGHYTSNLFKSMWGPLHYPYHTILFTKDGLRTSAPRWGMKLSSFSGCTMPTAWCMSFENIFKSLTKSKKRGRTALYSLFIMGSAPFVLLDFIIGKRSGTGIFDFELSLK